MRKMGLIGGEEQDNSGLRIGGQHGTHNALDSANAVRGGEMAILVVIDGEFDEEQIRHRLRQHIASQTEGAGVGAGRADARVDEIEVAMRKQFAQGPLGQARIAVHLGN